MNVETQIGEMARRTLIALGSQGEMAPTEIGMTVDASPQLLDFALGWLVRENKIEILNENACTRIRLKIN